MMKMEQINKTFIRCPQCHTSGAELIKIDRELRTGSIVMDYYCECCNKLENGS